MSKTERATRYTVGGVVVVSLALMGYAGVRVVSPQDGAAGSSASVSPGDSWNAAYQAAQPGDTIVVAAGSYGTQLIQRQGVKNPPVVFQGGPGVVVSSIDMGMNTVPGPLGLELRDMTIGDLGIKFADDVTLRNLSLGLLNAAGTKRLTWIGGEVGPWTNGVVNINTCTGSVPSQCISNQGSEDVTIDGVYFHDFLINDPEPHAECLQINGTGGSIDGLTIRNSTFQNCTDYGILSTGKIANVLIENNFFDEPFPGDRATTACNPNCPRSGYAIDLDPAQNSATNVTIQYNSSLGYMRVRDTAPLTNVVFRGNIGKKNQCTGGSTHLYNVWSGTTCGTGDRVVSSFWTTLWVDGDPSDGSMDFHLLAANGWGDPLSFPATDIDGDARSSPPDVGADQFAGAPPPPTTTEPPPTTTEPPPTTTEPPPCGPPLLTAGVQTDQTSTLTWASVPGASGYRLYKAGVLVATAGPLATSSKFGSLRYGTTLLGVATLCPAEKLSTLRSIETRVVTP